MGSFEAWEAKISAGLTAAHPQGMNTPLPPVVCVIVKKRHPVVNLGRAQQYSWTAVNWSNRRKLATSGERFTNRADALSNAIQLFADATVDQALLEQALHNGMWKPSNVYLIQDGISGMQALRLQPPTV